MPVVDDFVQHVDGRAVEFERALDDVDGAHHAGAKATRFGKDGVHGQGGEGSDAYHTAARLPRLGHCGIWGCVSAIFRENGAGRYRAAASYKQGICVVSLAPVLQQALLPVGGIMAVGYVWRRLRPAGIDAPTARRVIGALVMYVYYPALAFHTVVRAEVNAELILAPLLTMFAIVLGMALAFGLFRQRFFALSGPAQLGALVFGAVVLVHPVSPGDVGFLPCESRLRILSSAPGKPDRAVCTPQSQGL